MHKERKSPPSFKLTINQKNTKEAFPIQGVENCLFPFAPYPEQQKAVEKINQSIVTSKNLLFESPTGTGKTICLLIGALSAVKTLNDKKTKIFYLTRTHSQISQVLEELKKTNYGLKTNIIASRDHFCLNNNLQQLKGKVLQRACNDLVCKKLCIFKQNNPGNIPMGKTHTLEQFKQVCKKERVCPYFYSRQMSDRCEMTILPFNYFLDWKIFQSFAHSVKDSVIIFDEAHNVDTLAEQGSSLCIEQNLLCTALSEIKHLLKRLKGQNQSVKQVRNEAEVAFKIIEKLKDSIAKSDQTFFCSFDQLAEFLYSATTVADPINSTELLFGFQVQDNDLFFQNLHNLVKTFYKKQVPCKGYQDVIYYLERTQQIMRDKSNFKDFLVKIVSQDNKKTLSIKCLSPSITFKAIKQQRPKSIILSSGTLGNLQKWQKYMEIPFQKLSISGFITKKQLFATVLAQNNDKGIKYQFNYHRKDDENQHLRLAEELKKLQKTIPKHNGIVVAFSTYSLMQKVLPHCMQLDNKIFFESKAGDMHKIFRQYADKVKEKGAFLFIVMKGRFSEGINFKDELCRCLVVVGIPFLPRKDIFVDEKMKYLTENFSAEEAEIWYRNQTFQAVNQTIGRVIRSKKDYGVILLVDHRYKKKQNLEQLSAWFRSSLIQSQNIYEAIRVFFHSEPWLRTPNCSQVNAQKDKILNQTAPSESIGNKTVLKKIKHLKLKFEEQTDTDKDFQIKHEAYPEEPYKKLEFKEKGQQQWVKFKDSQFQDKKLKNSFNFDKKLGPQQFIQKKILKVKKLHRSFEPYPYQDYFMM